VAARLDGGVVLLGAAPGAEKVSLVAVAGEAARAAGVACGDLIRVAAAACGGRGGGRPAKAQGGGRDPSSLPAALAAVRQHLEELARGDG
jgi:alanyl-tRNA synthetase